MLIPDKPDVDTARNGPRTDYPPPIIAFSKEGQETLPSKEKPVIVPGFWYLFATAAILLGVISCGFFLIVLPAVLDKSSSAVAYAVSIGVGGAIVVFVILTFAISRIVIYLRDKS